MRRYAPYSGNKIELNFTSRVLN